MHEGEMIAFSSFPMPQKCIIFRENKEHYFPFALEYSTVKNWKYLHWEEALIALATQHKGPKCPIISSRYEKIMHTEFQ